MGRARFNQLNVVSRDPAASIAFYRRLGVDLPDGSVWRTETGIHHANARAPRETATSLEIDSAAFAPFWNAAWRGRTDLEGRIVVGFRVDSRAEVDAIYAELTGAGHPGLQPPWDAFWGARYAIVEDPDGLAVGIMSPVSAEKRAPPPDV